MDLSKVIQTESLDEIQRITSWEGFTTDGQWLDYQALNCALKCRRNDVAELLLQKNCRVNYTLKTMEDTPLHHAVQLAAPKLVSSLLEKQASIAVLNADGNSPLHLAFLHKQYTLVDMMLEFIEKQSSFSNPKNSQGLTHLHIACTRNNTTVIEDFLINGALIEDVISVNSMKWPGYNAFHFAAEFKSMTAIKVLLNQATDASLRARLQQNHHKKTPLQLINQQLEQLSIMSSLMTTRGFTHFHMACVGKDPHLVEHFLDNGVDLNRKSLSLEKFCPSYSPLHFATLSTNYENVELLLNHRADIDSKNKDDMTPAQLALYNQKSPSNDRIVKMLYDAVDDKLEQTPDKNGLSYLHLACSMNDIPTIDRFLKKGEDVDGKVTYERQRLFHYTPLHFAVKYEHLDTAKYLIGRGADVNSGEDCVDGTPLHLACKIGHPGLMDFLLECGADVKAIRACDRKTPLHLLVERCLDQQLKNALTMPFVAKLMKLGVDVNAQDDKGDTVLHMACREICYGIPCVKLFLENGADLDIENDSGMTAFDCQLESYYVEDHVQPGDYTILYHHVRKLMAIGFPVNRKNEKCCKRLLEERRFDWDPEKLALDFQDEELDRLEIERIDEVSRMEELKIANDVSLYNFVRMEPRQAKSLGTHESMIEHLQRDFPVYGYLLRLQHQKAVEYGAMRGRIPKRRRTK